MLHMMFDKKYWFVQKRFGWGAIPNTWQGWLFTALYVGIVFGVTMIMMRDQQTIQNPLWWGAFLILTVLFIVIVHFKTDGGLGTKGG